MKWKAFALTVIVQMVLTILAAYNNAFVQVLFGVSTAALFTGGALWFLPQAADESKKNIGRGMFWGGLVWNGAYILSVVMMIRLAIWE